MRLVYRQGLLARIEEALEAARRSGQTVEAIALTPREAHELYIDLYSKQCRAAFMRTTFEDFLQAVQRGEVLVRGTPLGLEA